MWDDTRTEQVPISTPSYVLSSSSTALSSFAFCLQCYLKRKAHKSVRFICFRWFDGNLSLNRSWHTLVKPREIFTTDKGYAYDTHIYWLWDKILFRNNSESIEELLQPHEGFIFLNAFTPFFLDFWPRQHEAEALPLVCMRLLVRVNLASSWSGPPSCLPQLAPASFGQSRSFWLLQEGLFSLLCISFVSDKEKVSAFVHLWANPPVLAFQTALLLSLKPAAADRITTLTINNGEWCTVRAVHGGKNSIYLKSQCQVRSHGGFKTLKCVWHV